MASRWSAPRCDAGPGGAGGAGIDEAPPKEWSSCRELIHHRDVLLRASFAAVLVGAGVMACGQPPLVLKPLAPAGPVCPLEGCRAEANAPPARPASACRGAGEAPCAGSSANACLQRALALWGDEGEKRGVACAAQMLDEACSLGDAHACAFSGRMWIDGRGQPRDPQRGMTMVVRACDGGVMLSCVFGTRWLSEPSHAREVSDAIDLRARFEAQYACLEGEAEACYRVGLLYYFGRGAFPRDPTRAASAYARGCHLGDSRACNNLGDALAYGDGTERDVVQSAALFEKACHLGEALGCANLGYMVEYGRGIARDRARARVLYRDACATGDVYGCLHQAMLAAEDAGAPRDPARALVRWNSACEARDARACAFVGVIYEDGPDGVTRNEGLSLQAMKRACELGNRSACEWVKAHGTE